MSIRPDKPREYFAKLLGVADEGIDYSEIPPTTAADWENTEVLLPVTAEEFRAIKRFIESRRGQSAQPMHHPLPHVSPTDERRANRDVNGMAQHHAQSTGLTSDQKKLWLEQEIWPEIHAMMHNDGYFRLWLKAQEFSGTHCGPIGQMVVNGYATYQVAAVRRLCDRSRNVISLPKLLRLISNEQPHRSAAIASLGSRLEKECAEIYTMATQYIAHNGNPTEPNWQHWTLTLEKINMAQKAICEVAVIIERDLLAITHRMYLIPIPQFDYLLELRTLVPCNKLDALRDFWHRHNDSINAWVHVPRVT